MKKYLLLSILTLVVPFLIIYSFINIQNINFKSQKKENIKIRIKQKNGNIISIPLEEYVIGVVSGEMPTTFNIEALKAQAVASRTYALYQKSISKNDFDVYDDTSSQVYLTNNYLKEKWKNNYTQKHNIILKAVNDTSLEYLTYDNKIAETFFFSTSPGMTENSEDVFSTNLPYLRSVSSVWDKVSPKYESSVNISLEEFYKKINIPYNDKLEIKYDLTNTGRVKNIIINNKTFKGREISKILSLRSNYFRIYQNNKMLNINVLGFGHGVGMSQYGANGMANMGKNYKEILSYYYQGTILKKLA